MTKRKKNAERFAPPPVVTGHDDRPGEKTGDRDLPQRGAEAPDSISGYRN